jgi:hypothetical protein
MIYEINEINEDILYCNPNSIFVLDDNAENKIQFKNDFNNILYLCYDKHKFFDCNHKNSRHEELYQLHLELKFQELQSIIDNGKNIVFIKKDTNKILKLYLNNFKINNNYQLKIFKNEYVIIDTYLKNYNNKLLEDVLKGINSNIVILKTKDKNTIQLKKLMINYLELCNNLGIYIHDNMYFSISYNKTVNKQHYYIINRLMYKFNNETEEILFLLNQT